MLIRTFWRSKRNGKEKVSVLFLWCRGTFFSFQFTLFQCSIALISISSDNVRLNTKHPIQLNTISITFCRIQLVWATARHFITYWFSYRSGELWQSRWLIKWNWSKSKTCFSFLVAYVREKNKLLQQQKNIFFLCVTFSVAFFNVFLSCWALGLRKNSKWIRKINCHFINFFSLENLSKRAAISFTRLSFPGSRLLYRTRTIKVTRRLQILSFHVCTAVS